MYQTVRYEIKEGHDMYRYCRQVCRSFKNMYNVANFYIRQLLTGFNKLEDKRTPNERDAVRNVTKLLEQRSREPGAGPEDREAEEAASCPVCCKSIPGI